MMTSSFFSSYLISSSLSSLMRMSCFNSQLISSIFSLRYNSSSVYSSILWFLNVLLAMLINYFSSSAYFYLAENLFLSFRFCVFFIKLSSSSGLSNRTNISQRRQKIELGAPLAKSSIFFLLSRMSSFFKTLSLRVVQFTTLFANELAGIQLCNSTILGQQWQMSSAIMTPSEKSRWMFFLGLERGILSIISQMSFISASFIILYIKFIRIDVEQEGRQEGGFDEGEGRERERE